MHLVEILECFLMGNAIGVFYVLCINLVFWNVYKVPIKFIAESDIRTKEVG